MIETWVNWAERHQFMSIIITIVGIGFAVLSFAVHNAAVASPEQQTEQTEKLDGDFIYKNGQKQSLVCVNNEGKTIINEPEIEHGANFDVPTSQDFAIRLYKNGKKVWIRKFQDLTCTRSEL